MADQFERLQTALGDRYRIEHELGAGGMATVYLAHDLKHDRNVAVKVLRPELAASLGPDRFLQEIRIASQIHHPHILQLYDSGDAGGILYYVMPYVEGESLRDKLNREGDIPVAEAVRILRDVVDALAEAHDKSVVHRDIKPDNVLLSGRHALVTDFGVAKAVSEATGRQQLTTAGVALGTPAYMAPEQAAADRHIDHRADIYAVGVLAYEMLTGTPPFTGGTAQEVLAAHVLEPPDPVTTRRTTVPPALAAAVMRCLEKKPDDRWQSAHELLRELEGLATPSGGVTPTSTRSLKPATPSRTWFAAALVLAIATVAVVAGMWTSTTRGPSESRAVVTPVQLTANPVDLSVSGAAISPDGNYLAYTDPRGLHLQELAVRGETHTLELPHALSPWKVWWFPDGTRLLFLATNETEDELTLWSVSMLGERPNRLQDRVFTAAISPDGTHIAFIRSAGTRDRAFREIWIMGPNGEDPRRMVTAAPEESFWNLAWVPGSTRLACGSWNLPAANLSEYRIGTVRIDGSDRAMLVSDSTLFQNWTGILPFTWCADGRLLYGRRDGPPHQNTSNVWVAETDSDGRRIAGPPRRVTQLPMMNVRELSATASCDAVVALLVRNQADVWIGELSAAGDRFVREVQLTFDQREDLPMVWSADSREVFFASSRGGTYDLYRKGMQSDDAEAVYLSAGEQHHGALSPDGTALLYIGRLPDGPVQRIALSGGVAQTLLEGEYKVVKCHRSGGSFCSAGRTDGDEYVFVRFDPERGDPRDELRISHRAPFTNWDLSPDGSTVAVVHNDDNVIRLITLDGGQEITVDVEGWSSFEFVAWAADGEGLFVNAGFAMADKYPAVLRVGMDGRATVLRQRASDWHVDMDASRDGRYLAFASMPFHGNAWLITGF